MNTQSHIERQLHLARAVSAAVVGALLALAFAMAGWTADARAEFRVEAFNFEILDSNAQFEAQVGARPHEVVTKIEFGTTTNQHGELVPDDNVKTTQVILPPGLVGNPTATPRCDFAELFTEGACPDSTQIGVFFLTTASHGEFGPFPIYNVAPQSDVPAQFLVTIPVFMNAHVRADGSIMMEVENASQGLTAYGVTIRLWGVPADPAHDNDRGLFGACYPLGSGFAPCSAGVVRKPLLTNATRCSDQPQMAVLRANSWQHPKQWAEDTVTAPAPLAGCDKLVFEPSVRVEPHSDEAGRPSGYDIEVSVPQNEDPDGLATAHLKRAEVRLPEGVAINPAVANGLATCSQEQIDLDSTAKPRCPDASKIGRVVVETPLLDEPLRGAVYQAAQGDNPFGSNFALYLVPEGSGVRLKLPGEVTPDPVTGQLTATFDDNPELPFSKLTVSLKDGSRAPLVNPETCGVKTAQSTFVPWSAADPDNPTPDEIVASSDTFEITEGPDGEPCPETLADRPFEPQMNAGVTNPVAGSFTPFTFQLKRQDGHQEILSTEVTPPEGVTARLASVALCEESDAQAGACNESNRVGTAIVGAGAGASPFYIQEPNEGKAYLAGPYDPDGPGGEAEEAPLSLVIKVPAIAGPFDLGEVVVRAAVYVDPTTAQLRVVSDPIPQILEGMPLRVRDIRIRMDREAFTIAPTDCTETKVEATAYGSHGAEADLENRFQVGECASLGFKPNLTFQATGGKKATKRNAHPGLKANLVVPGADAYSEGAERGSQANIKRVQVTLPKGLFLDQASPALTDPCTREEYEQNDCPASSKVGTAIAHTPLLDEPLEGPVYLRTSSNPLPDLVADLDGIVDIDLVGAVSQAKQRIRNTFALVPDVPVSSFELRLAGGAKGLLVNSNTGKGLCGKGRRQVNVAMRAHNNRAHSYKTQMKAQCPKPKKKGKGKKAKRGTRR